ncbi:MAG: flagellar hook-basal body protein [Wujia sp.]
MMRSLWTAASGMRAQQVNVDTIANNVSNINTIGYKSQQASFKSLLYQNLQSKSTNNAGENKPVPAEVGLGTRVAAITSNFTKGNLTATEDAFSIAIDGDGFFQVRTQNGDLQYTRDGSFIVSPVANGNMLCTSDGEPVMDANGNSIVLPNTHVATEMVVNQDGTIAFPDATGNPVVMTDANGQPIRFGIYQFNNPAGLYKEGGNRFSVTIASGDAISENGGANLKQSRIVQYYTEASNVDVANEMVNLIVAQRAYEMNSKAIQASDEMMQQANNLR